MLKTALFLGQHLPRVHKAHRRSCNHHGFDSADFLTLSSTMHSPRHTLLNQPSTRRQSLKSMLAMLSMLSGAVWHQPVMATSDLAQPEANLLRLVSLPQAASVGAALLPQLGQTTRAELVASLTSRLSVFFSQELTGFCHVEVLQHAFQKAVQADFAQGRCQTVSGWV